MIDTYDNYETAHIRRLFLSIGILSLLGILILLIISLISHYQNDKKNSNRNISTSKVMNKGISGSYLNVSSTAASKTGVFNPSDIAYPDNINLRENVNAFKESVLKYINAPSSARVIINSGATESIANCIYWAKTYNPYGSISGTTFDHTSVKDNCDNFDVKYIPDTNITNLDDKASLLFLTHVNPRTGEILNVPNFVRNLNAYTFMNETQSFNNITSNTRQYRPIVVLDASQSIGKIPIDMKAWNLNAVFFSLHKIGGDIGVGVLIVNDHKLFPFRPLIGGKQQNGLRGGTMPIQKVVDFDLKSIESDVGDINERKAAWEQARSKMLEAGLKVYTPKMSHLYNTLLIQVNECPLNIISKLASKNIYIGNVSACKNEDILSGGSTTPTDDNGAVRISFSSSSDLSPSVVDSIISAINNQ